MPLPLTVSCLSEIQIGFTFLVPAHLGSPGKRPLNGYVCIMDISWIGYGGFADTLWLCVGSDVDAVVVCR